MPENIKAALIGCGRFAKRHGGFLARERAAGIDLHVACDRDADRAGAFAEEFGVPKVSTDAAEALADPDVEAAMIVTDPAGHVPLVIDAIRAGKPVFCEKPLSAGPDQRAALRETLAEYPQALLVVGYCFRFSPTFVKARELVAPAAMSVALVLNQEPGGAHYLTHNACHAVDTVLSMHAADVTDVSATANAWPPETPGEQFTLQLRFADGTLSTVICGAGGAGSLLSKWYYKVLGQRGRVAEVTRTGGEWSLYADGEAGVYFASDYYEGHRDELRHFARCVRTGQPSASTAERALRVDEILEDAARQLGF